MAADIPAVRVWLAQRASARQQALDIRFREAWSDFRAIVEHLIAHYPVQRIYQWGSLLHRSRFTPRSDIDLAIEGVHEAGDFFALYGAADRLTRFSLDLVDLGHVEPEFAGLIREHGALIYDRDRPDPGPHFRN